MLPAARSRSFLSPQAIIDAIARRNHFAGYDHLSWISCSAALRSAEATGHERTVATLKARFVIKESACAGD
jgi:hypothetical protein